MVLMGITKNGKCHFNNSHHAEGVIVRNNCAHKRLKRVKKKLDKNGGQTQVNIEVTFFLFFTVVIAQVITVTLKVIWLETQSVRVKKNSCNYQKNISSSL